MNIVTLILFVPFNTDGRLGWIFRLEEPIAPFSGKTQQKHCFRNTLGFALKIEKKRINYEFFYLILGVGSGHSSSI